MESTTRYEGRGRFDSSPSLSTIEAFTDARCRVVERPYSLIRFISLSKVKTLVTVVVFALVASRGLCGLVVKVPRFKTTGPLISSVVQVRIP